MLRFFLRGLPPGRMQLLEQLLVFNIIVSRATGSISSTSLHFLGAQKDQQGKRIALADKNMKLEEMVEAERRERNAKDFQRFLSSDDEQPPFPWDLMAYCVIIWLLTLWCFLYCTTCGKKARGIIPLNEEDQEAFEIASDLASQKSKLASNATASTEKNSQDLGSDFPTNDDPWDQGTKRQPKGAKGPKGNGPNAATEFVISGKYKKPEIGDNENFKKAGISEAELSKVK